MNVDTCLLERAVNSTHRDEMAARGMTAADASVVIASKACGKPVLSVVIPDNKSKQKTYGTAAGGARFFDR